MKRLSLLVFSVLFALAGLNAQTIVLEEDFSALENDSSTTSIANTLNQYTHVPGWSGDWVYPSNGKVKLGSSSKAGFIMTPALDLSANDGNFTVSFDIKVWSGDQTRMYVEVNGVDNLVEGLSSTQFNTITLELSGGTAATTVKFKSYQASKARLFLDNIVITSVAGGPDTVGPVVTKVTPSANNVTVKFNENLDQTSAENTANYVLDNNISVTSAALNGNIVTLGVSPALTEGNTYTLIVSNVKDDDDNIMAGPDTITFTFGIDPQFHAATIAELRAKWTEPLNPDDTTYGHTVYKLNGHAIITGVNNSYRHQVFIQDATGAIVIDDPSGKINSELESGDEVAEIYGTLTDYFGLLQFVITEPYTAEALSVYNDVTPLTVTLSQLQDIDFMNAHQCELIHMNEVIINPLTSANFENGKKYSLTQNGETGNGLWIHFFNISTLSGQPIPTYPVNITGPNKISYSQYYIIPREGADITTGIPQYLTENDILVYPNPVSDQLNVTLKTDEFQVTRIALYDINGKLVLTQPVSDNLISVNARQLSSGSYFLRLSDGKHSFTTKIVKK